MRQLYSIKPHKRRQLIVVLTSLFALLLLTDLVENKNLQRMGSDVASLYQDRLVPAAQMYELSELMHEKRLTFELLNDETYQLTPEKIAEMSAENIEIAEILEEYEKTHLVDEEEAYLKTFKQNLADYLVIESRILHYLQNGDYNAARLLINSQGRELAEKVSEDLYYLAEIQTKIGEELMQHYNSHFGSSSTLYYFKVALIIFMGCLVIRILGFTEMVSGSKQKFELN